MFEQEVCGTRRSTSNSTASARNVVRDDAIGYLGTLKGEIKMQAAMQKARDDKLARAGQSVAAQR